MTEQQRLFMRLFPGAAARFGVTTIELLVVTTIAILLLLPTLDFLLSSRKSASKGFEMLETLDAARMVLERVQRDLRALYSGPMHGFVPQASETVAYSFPAFPSGAAGLEPGGDTIPLNQVTYVFDPRDGTLTRSVRWHPDLRRFRSGDDTQVIARNVASFSICPQELLTIRYYDVQVVCSSRGRGGKSIPITLRTAVCSDFESRLKRHPFHPPNRRTIFSPPP
jgi:hypothetical protein